MVCVPCNMLDLLGATVGRAAQECPCKTAIALLVRLGAKHAAKSHADGAVPKTKEDAELHMQEEEKLFFPLLPKNVERQFVAEHQIFRAELKKYGRIKSVGLWLDHANRENLWAGRLLDQDAAGVSIAGARTGTARTGLTETVTDADRAAAVMSDARIQELCTILAPTMGGPENCFASLRKARTDAQLKIAQIEDTDQKPPSMWSKLAPKLVPAGLVIASGVTILLIGAAVQKKYMGV